LSVTVGQVTTVMNRTVETVHLNKDFVAQIET